ncbi:MAG: MBL fold metallo-hydrolase [Rhodospirillales bacterium]|nr:MBL fold metallo-hydrolase [Rhodospirillales bacterium]
MKCVTLFRRQQHRWLAFGQDSSKPENVIDTNQMVVCSGRSAILLDPGGMEVFPSMIAALTQEVAIDEIGHIFLSHQDPDVSSALPLWRRVCREDTTVYVPWMWTSFISHFDRDARFTAIPDEGMEINLGGDVRLKVLPAHYLHSPGNYHVYDPTARILFTGDIGAALVPANTARDMFVEDFHSHVQYMEGFHRRWMGSAPARDAWVEMVSRLDIQIMAPQHGLLFKGDDVKRFLDWLSGLDLGSGLAAYRRT